MTFYIGPLRLYKAKNDTLDISLKYFDDCSFGWEWGYPEYASKPQVCLRIGPFWILYFEKFQTGFEIRILGFWWIK